MQLENNIIRKYKEPRVHFAINCCSWSCPRLPIQLFHADSFSQQLDEATRRFVNVDGGVVLKPDSHYASVYLSKVFTWFSKDFDGYGGGLVNFINKYKQVGKRLLVSPQH